MAKSKPVTVPPPSTSPLLRIRMGELHIHPGQMRTVYDPAAMTSLIVQVHEAGGIASWQPIVATPRPEGEGYFIVSGHRRHMAMLFLWALEDTYPAIAPQDLPDIVQGFLDSLLAQHTTLDAAAEALRATYATTTLEVHLFEGDLKTQLLALQRANYGAHNPDPLGIARSFHAALKAGATEKQIAHNAGQSIGYVKKHLALLRIPAELAEAIAINTFPLSLAEMVAEVQPESARQGLSLFLLANAAHVLVESVRTCASLLKSWDQFRTPPMTVAHQGQRNMIRLLAGLWQRALETDPAHAWASVALLFYRNSHAHAPWEHQPTYVEWVKVLGGEIYHSETEGIRWEPLVHDLLVEVSCATCPIHTLPPQILNSDLSDRADALGRPCRTSARESYSRCVNGFALGDTVEVRVPFEWAAHSGVVKQGSHYVILGIVSLQQAWHAQATTEAEHEAVTLPQTEVDPVAQAAAPKSTTPAKPKAKVAPATPTTAAPPETPAPVSAMREQIRSFMEHHTAQAWQHPFATPCGLCQHRLEQSPTKDTAVPHCAWAARFRTLRFTQLTSSDQALAIPVCHQHAPTRSWQELIPAHPQPFALPRNYLLEQIRLHVKAADRLTVSDRHPFEFLTGRPMTAESYQGWFTTQLGEQVGTLSDAQLSTLFVWSLSEYERAQSTQGFTLPRDTTSSTFIPVTEIAWSVVP